MINDDNRGMWIYVGFVILCLIIGANWHPWSQAEVDRHNARIDTTREQCWDNPWGSDDC